MDFPALIDSAITRATELGALIPIETASETIRDAGIDFRVEWVSSLALKDSAKIPRAGDKPKADFNPFLPYEEALHVADLSPTHTAILNKFPSRRGHLVLITREFEEQDSPLGSADFEACASVLQGAGGFLFFNCGAMAGASQRHRHMQLIPDLICPIEAVLPTSGFDGGLAQAPLPYRNGFRRWNLRSASPHECARLIGECVAAGYDLFDLHDGPGRVKPHNFFMTQDWFCIVPRIAEASAGISLSALSLAGLIGLRTPDQAAIASEAGPARMLIEVAGKA